MANIRREGLLHEHHLPGVARGLLSRSRRGRLLLTGASGLHDHVQHLMTDNG
jgi:hypothetical protein